ncbi:hypothetical protein SAMN05192539_103925 [Paraburkholderia diazotrophica]|uniref:Uncharacterized protein n=1 Tax=Paraburkholderia diazotrophica TaxID=667676 RepID=A0A1H7E1C5_9BURK|nr:hypothetical protein SAMN05192539_103925 [Paraburkholderia diazotrophica]
MSLAAYGTYERDGKRKKERMDARTTKCKKVN